MDPRDPFGMPHDVAASPEGLLILAVMWTVAEVVWWGVRRLMAWRRRSR